MSSKCVFQVFAKCPITKNLQADLSPPNLVRCVVLGVQKQTPRPGLSTKSKIGFGLQSKGR